MVRRTKKENAFSPIGSMISGYINEFVGKAVGMAMKYFLTATFAVLGCVFLFFALRDILMLFAPNYVVDGSMGIVLLLLAMMLKRG